MERTLHTSKTQCLWACQIWLMSRRPPVTPASIALGQPLSKLQWRLVRELQHQSMAWENPHITAAGKGRSASKMETLERALNVLGSLDIGGHPFEDPVASLRHGVPPHRNYLRLDQTFASGLQRASGGDVVQGSKVSAGSTIAAKQIEIDCLPLTLLSTRRLTSTRPDR